MSPKTILFVPVSSPSGIGEYIRSLIIAKALLTRWPKINIHFILNEEVEYISSCPYQVHTCKGSPTKDVQNVNAIVKRLSPELVIFDASGRASQFKQAKLLGAKVAFISQHNKKRNRGLKLNRLLHTDIHWVVQPDYCMKKLSFWQQRKLSLFNKKAPQNIGPVFELPPLDKQLELLDDYSLSAGEYIIVNAGSGGHIIDGELAADIFYQAAKAIYKETKANIVVVFGSNYPNEIPQDNDVLCLGSLSNSEFVSLINQAKTCMLSAGDTLLQAISLGKVCVSAAVSPDQPARLKHCHKEDLVIMAQASINSLLSKALLLTMPLNKESATVQKRLKYKTEQQGANMALDIIVNDISLLLQNDLCSQSRKSQQGSE